ncbi:MAG: ECF transporter S component [Ruminococcus sp.]|nr:ECF transporter S component [Ruminococcus sp.]
MIAIRNRNFRRVIKFTVPFLMIPALAMLCIVVFEGKRYMIISLFSALFALLLFACGYEKKNTGTKRMVVASAMTALCFAGRFIPVFKPVSAMTIITGMYMGSETGFLVGAMTALVSDFYFGQGPWTPFQMLAWGLIGYIAGVLSKPLKKSRIFLIVWGAFSGLLFSLIMDLWSVLWYSGELTIKLYLAAFVTALPHTVIYAVSNAVFLYLLEKPFGEKLSRLRIKGGF